MKAMKQLFCVISLFGLIMKPSCSIRVTRTLSPRVVNTKYGGVRGLVVNLGVKGIGDAEAFLGIPYASPPIGNLRFMPPGAPHPWGNIKQADTFGAVCPQRLPDIRNESVALKTMSRARYVHLRHLLPYLKNQSENCLYLNIYTPAGGKYISFFVLPETSFTFLCNCTRIAVNVFYDSY